MKFVGKFIVFVSIFCMLISSISNVFASDSAAIQTAISSGIDYYKTVQKEVYETTLDKVGTPFHAMLRAETSMISQTDYLYLIPNYDINDVSKFTTCREYADMIIISVLTGRDPKTLIEGFDVVEKLANLQDSSGIFENTNLSDKPFSIEDHLWSMLALDLLNYDYDRTKALSVVVDAEFNDGGFSEAGVETVDLDITALSVIVLSKYTNPAAVAINKRSIELIKQYYKEGNFIDPYGSGEVNVITHSLSVIALIAGGEQIWNEPYTTEEYNPIDYLLKCQDANGGFWYSKSYKAKPSGDHKQPEDYASAVSLCAILDYRNMRSYIMKTGEVFTDTTHTIETPEPIISGFEIKYVLYAGRILIVFLVLIFIIGLFRTKKDKQN